MPLSTVFLGWLENESRSLILTFGMKDQVTEEAQWGLVDNPPTIVSEDGGGGAER